MYQCLLTTMFLLITFFHFRAQADWAPTIYGNFQFEYRYFHHEAQNYSPITAGGSTVENFPNRLGIYGIIPTSNFSDTKLTYVAEVSLAPRKNPGEVNLRLVAANLENFLGTLTIGQCYTAASLTGLEFDPLYTTGAGQIGYDLTFDGKTNHGLSGIGYNSRWYNDAIKYTSPKKDGFQLSFSIDHDSAPRMNNSGPSPVFDKEIFTHPNSAPATYYEALGSYQWQKEQTSSATYLGLISGSGSTFSLDFSTYINQDRRWYLGQKVRWQNIAIGVLYSQLQQRNQFNEDNKPNSKRLLAFLGLVQERWQYDVTYGLVQFDSDRSQNAADHRSAQLLAASMMRQLATTANLRLSAFHYLADHAAPAAAQTDNSTIWGLLAGLSLKF